MHILKFLDELPLTPHVEIVEARLPELRQRMIATRETKTQLWRRHFPAWFTAQPARHALLQDLHDRRGRSFGRLADEQVNVFRHDDVADQ